LSSIAVAGLGYMVLVALGSGPARIAAGTFVAMP